MKYQPLGTFFDNDIEGKTKMIQKLKNGNTVFMWDKFLKDFRIPSKKGKRFKRFG